jgi:BioD-like phosphotransacetylase family protein
VAVLQITSDQPGAGKTSLAGALLLHLAESGKRAGYYKPFSNHPGEDPDGALVTQSLLDASSPSQVPEPFPLLPFNGAGPSLVNPAADEVQRTVKGLQDQCDLVLLEGPDLVTPTGQASPLPLELSSLIDSRVLLLIRYAKDLRAADVQRAAQPFGDRLAGVLINGVTLYRNREVNQSTEALLAPEGIPFWGTLREDRSMFGVTVQQIADYLGGRWAQEPENTEASVERFLIGGNIMDLGPTYFGRYPNQAVIVRAGRPDIQMAGLMPETRCLVLTGSEELTEYVKAEALQRGVPLILVESNTLETAEALGGILDHTSALTRRKIDRFLQFLKCSLDLNALLALLG